MKFKFLTILVLIAFNIIPTSNLFCFKQTFSKSKLDKEGFEGITKSAYKDQTINLKSGVWEFNDALIGKSENDLKFDNQSVRIRNHGFIKTLFDISDLESISVGYGTYGADESSNWQLLVSYDAGLSFNEIKPIVISNSHNLLNATFALKHHGKIRLEIIKVSGGKNRINIDNINFIYFPNNIKKVIEKQLDVQKPKLRPPNSVSDISSVQMLLGNPSNATNTKKDSNNYLIKRQQFVESYNKTRAEPNWVSWHISISDLGTTDRMNDFRPDKDLPYGWYEVDNTSYKGSGFDKGHNCPSGDRTYSSHDNSSTFLMDNIFPQAPNNNQHTWEHFESYCRAKVKSGYEVYVIMGNYGTGGVGKKGFANTIDHGRINVPAHIWKVAVFILDGDNDLQRINKDTQIIAIDTPNDNNISPNWMNYLVTAREIEKITGYNLLSSLPKSLQDILETKKFKGGN